VTEKILESGSGTSAQLTKGCQELISEFQQRQLAEGKSACELLVFDIQKDLPVIQSAFCTLPIKESLATEITIYNPTKPLEEEGKRYLLGRVEPRRSEISKVMLFEERDSVWRVVVAGPVFDLQDPFYVRDVQGWHIFGGVQVYSRADDPAALEFRTVFYRNKGGLQELVELKNDLAQKPFASSETGMKDIRIIELRNGHVGVFTRPLGGEAGKGKIAFAEVESLDKLEEAIPRAEIIPNQFHDDEWGGANELHLLANGKIGVLGHIAHSEKDEQSKKVIRHYYAMAFVFDPVTNAASPLEILTSADDFPYIEPKKPDLGRIIFSGGLVRTSGDDAYLYVGIGDAHAGYAKIKDPFRKFED